MGHNARPEIKEMGESQRLRVGFGHSTRIQREKGAAPVRGGVLARSPQFFFRRHDRDREHEIFMRLL